MRRAARVLRAAPGPRELRAQRPGIGSLGHTLVVVGGYDANNLLQDTWLFDWLPATPDEVCANGVDDDGDRQIDGTDPDCD